MKTPSPTFLVTAGACLVLGGMVVASSQFLVWASAPRPDAPTSPGSFETCSPHRELTAEEFSEVNKAVLDHFGPGMTPTEASGQACGNLVSLRTVVDHGSGPRSTRNFLLERTADGWRVVAELGGIIVDRTFPREP